MSKKSTLQPQFTLDDLYITPFAQERVAEPNQAPAYQDIERNLHPTGIHVMDDYLRELSLGHSSRKAFCERQGITRQQLSALITILTGMDSDEFRRQVIRRNAVLLMRHTDLSIPDVVAHSGIGSRMALFRFLKDAYGCTAMAWRKKHRKAGDLGRYQL